MRAMNGGEVVLVCGGNDQLNSKVASACEGQPDSAVVTVSISVSADAGIGGIGGGRDVTITKEVEVNCGDFRAEQAKKTN